MKIDNTSKVLDVSPDKAIFDNTKVKISTNTVLNYKNIDSKISSYFEKDNFIKRQIEEF